jgi:hypothetical protein
VKAFCIDRKKVIKQTLQYRYSQFGGTKILDV